MAKREEKPGRKSSSKKSGDTGKSSRSSASKKSVRGASSKSGSSKSTPASRNQARRNVRRRPAVLSPALEELLENSARDAALHARSGPQLPMRGIEPLPIPFVNRGAPLPEGYGLDRLVALARDPWTLFCYWELNGTRLRALNRERGEGFIDACAWALRLHRIDEGIAQDIEIDSSAGCWYIQLDRQGRYQIELALLSPDGEWIALMASHIVQMPAEQPSPHANETWTSDDQLHADMDEEALRKLDELLWPEGLRSGSSGFAGSSRVRSSLSSFSFVSSLGSMGSLAQASSARVPGSWESSAGVSSFGASSGRIHSSGGSGGSGGVQNFSGTTPENFDANNPHHTIPVAEERPTFFGGPNWNAQPNLPPSGPGKSHQPHFKIKLPRILTGIPLPEPSWPSTPGNTRQIARS